MDRLATESRAQASKFVKLGPGVPEDYIGGWEEGADIAIIMPESSKPIGAVRVRDQCVTQSELNAFRFKDSRYFFFQHTSNSVILSGSSQMKGPSHRWISDGS